MMEEKKIFLSPIGVLLLILILLVLFGLGFSVYLSERIGEVEKRLANIENTISQSPEVSPPPEPTIVPVSPEEMPEGEQIEIPLP